MAESEPAAAGGNADTVLRGGRVIDPAAGFGDLQGHVNDLAGLRRQALDGVTTALELEAGASPVAAAYRAVAAQGRPINYGFSASWAQARMTEVGGFAPGRDT